MKTCPECSSKEVYQYKDSIATTQLSGELLPKLGTGFTSARVRPVVCAECGLVRLYASKETTETMTASKHWKKP
jgi:DNA-directed RNA polymerase subunit RPC12/RpoP